MRIQKLTIRNLRAIDELELDLTAPGGNPLDLILLAGPNGCGKTTALEACLMALKQDKLLPSRPNDPEKDYYIEIIVEINGELAKIVRDSTRTRSYSLQDDEWHSGILTRQDPLKSASCFYFSSWRAPKLVGSVGLSTGRGKRPKDTQENALWRLKQHLVNIKGAMSFRGSTTNAEEAFSRINSIWKDFYPEKNGRFEAEVISGDISDSEDEESSSSEDLSFDLMYFDDDHPEGVFVDDLSSGEIEILSMVGTFLLQKEHFDIVFLDEPELHLHPAWHRAILPALRKVSPDTQFMCATHSEDILESAYSYERFTLLDENDPRIRLNSRASGAQS